MTGVPAHVAIMMDGNGRWAKKRMLPREAGHNAGAKTLKALVPYAEEAGVKYLTVFAFSTENWKRSADEVKNLINLIRVYINDYLSEALSKNIRFSVIGDLARLDNDLQKSIENLVEQTKNKNGLRLSIALNYGGRDEIVRAVRKIANEAQNGVLNIDDISEEMFAKRLDTAELPEIDLWIRTGGDMRVSNFLLYQLAYAEIYFTSVLWPDFNAGELKKALDDFKGRKRSFGGR